MNKNTKPIEELRKSLNKQKKENKRNVLLEMIYNDEYEQDEDSPGYESVPELAHEEAQEGEAYGEGGQTNAPIEKPLPEEKGTDPEIMEIFSNIRQAVINGLAKLANKPDSISYDTMKKLLAIVDKPIEAANKDKQ